MAQRTRRKQDGEPAAVSFPKLPPGMTIEAMLAHRYDAPAGRDIFSKANEFALADQARDHQLYPFFQPLDNNDGPQAQIYGKRVLMFGSNNYLGLTRHPYVVDSAARAVLKYGTSMTGSRLLNGSIHMHEELERRIAQFVKKEAALVFTTGYQTNLGVISSLVSRRSVAVVDKSDHASIYDGCRLADGEMLRFNHNSAAHLDSVLSRIGEDKPCLVVIDGVFSMGGDIADLPGIVDVCRKYRARLLVDDAHAIGVIGEGGRGTGSHFDLENEVDLVMGTFSKSLASIGGFIAGPRKVLDWVKHFGRTLIFSASLPPASTAAALAALDILEREPEMVDHLHKLAAQWRQGLSDIGFDVGRSETPIVPINVGDEYSTVMFWKSLIEDGVYTNPVTYPAVPMGRAMLRTSCMATHTSEQIEQALERFRTVGRRQGILP